MGTIKISQEQINELVATRDDFWKSFHQSLSAPYSLWNNYKDVTFEKCVELVNKSPDLISSLNLMFEYTLLKGEVIISFYKGFILTNYRLIINDANAGKPSIPLSNLKSYNANGDGLIEFEKNGQLISLKYSKFLNDTIVNSAKARFLEQKLSENQFYLLSKSVFELKNDNPELIIHKLEMYPVASKQKHGIGLFKGIEIVKRHKIIFGFVIIIILGIIFSDEQNDSVGSVESTKECLMDYWVYKNEIGTAMWVFSSDGTFESHTSTNIFGDTYAFGYWTVESAGKIRVTYTRTTEPDGYIPEDQILTMPSCTSLKVGSTTFHKP